jgi:hypothetical protein
LPVGGEPTVSDVVGLAWSGLAEDLVNHRLISEYVIPMGLPLDGVLPLFPEFWWVFGPGAERIRRLTEADRAVPGVARA